MMRLTSIFSLIFFVERRNSMGLTDDEIVNVSKTKHLRCSYCCLTTIQSHVPKEKNLSVSKMFPRTTFEVVIVPLCTRFRC